MYWPGFEMGFEQGIKKTIALFMKGIQTENDEWSETNPGRELVE